MLPQSLTDAQTEQAYANLGMQVYIIHDQSLSSYDIPTADAKHIYESVYYLLNVDEGALYTRQNSSYVSGTYEIPFAKLISAQSVKSIFVEYSPSGTSKIRTGYNTQLRDTNAVH